jgi:LuxR family maltose regulon positive regulatory protein
MRKKNKVNTAKLGIFFGLQIPFLHKSLRCFYQLADDTIRESFFNGVFKDLVPDSSDTLFLGIEAGLYIEQNRLDEARKTLLKSEKSLNNTVSIIIGYGTYIMLAETALLKNDRQEYERYKSQAKAYLEERNALFHNKNFLAYETRTKLWDGDTKAAKEWLDNYFIQHSEFGFLYKVFQNVVTVRAYIVLGECGKALEALERIKLVCRSFDRELFGAEAEVLFSLTEWWMGNKKEAKERLLHLLGTLYPRNFIRVVANEGKAILPVLSSLLKILDKTPILPYF